MARLTNQDGQDPISITRVNGSTVETAMFAWDVRGGVVTQLFPASAPVGPRNTYSDWVNSGNPFNQTNRVTRSLGAFQLITTASHIFYQNEAQLQTTLTITTASQNQTRTCTASGGCDGPFSRTISFEVSRETSIIRVNTRASTTRNPRYVAPITDADLEGFVNCQIDRETGVVTFSQAGNLVNAEGGRINLFIRLAPGQTRNYNIIPFDGDPSSETISLLVSGEVPRGFANEGSLFEDIIVECDTTQQPEIQPPPTLSVRILWRNAFGSQNTRVS
nr:hypothetical protein [Gammaproteobacteria bacterium]